MSNDSLSTSPCPDAGQEAAPLDWLLSLLRDAMVGVMADDTPPLKKANALARFGNLYLKTYNTAELKRLNAELEERLAAAGVETTSGEVEAASQPGIKKKSSTAASKTGKGAPSKPRSHGRPRPPKRPHARPSPQQKTAGKLAGQ